MIVQHNITAMNANRMLGLTTGSLSKSTEKLSSGYRINRAADDAAGLTISEKMRKQIRGLDQASTNAEDGVSAVQTAEGALTEVHSMLQRMNELAVQASNGTNSEDDRKAIQDEISQLTTEIDRVSETTKFNETYLLKGDGSKSTKTVNAHDAGLAGKLVDNGNGTSTFTADDLKVGDKVTIAGKEYTIGKSADVADYVKKGSITGTKAPAKTGDSVTHNGVTTTIVDKITTADAQGATWAAGDTFIDADGKEWSVIADTGKTDATKGEVKVADVATYLKDGSTITKNANLKVGTGAVGDIAKKLTVVDALEDTEVSRNGTAGIGNLAANAVAGDIVTANGTSLEVTEETPTSMKDVAAAIKAANKGATITIGTKSYTLGVATDKDNDTYTADDLISMIKEGDTVNDGAADYTVIGVSATTAKDADTITLNEAYNKMAEELQKASSIGTDEGKAATVSNKGNGTFEIKNGSVEVKNGLSFNLHVGADADMTNKINVDIDTMSAAGLGIKDINVADDTGAAATYAIDAIADAVAKVSSQRSALGAVQNRLEHTIDNLDNVVENTTSAESRIRDTDMAEEMVNYSKNSILQQAGQSMLAQANQANQGVLSLLQ
ncbi:MAG: flagellar hook protein [Roseburia sp.]|nr:flagellar hook protein [Roseburia sp.]